MPSKSLITSWTTSFVPSGTRFSHSGSRRKAYPENSSPSSPRRRVLRHLHGLWKGSSIECFRFLTERDFDDYRIGTSSSPRKSQLASDPVPRRVSSTISIPGVTLASRPSPTPSSLVLSPPSPTTPAPLPSGVDTESNAIKFSDVGPRGVLSDTFNGDLSPSSGAPAEPACTLEPSSYCKQPVSQSQYLPDDSPLPCRTSTSLAATRYSTSAGYTLDAATRLQDFRALIDELRDALLHHDSEEFDTGNCGDDEEERERLLRLLEEVMRKVQQLAENDALGGHGRLSQ